MEKHSGSCLCGQITYEVNGHFESFFLCHCKHCQKDTGSAHAANLFSSSAKLTWISGEDKVRTFLLNSTRHSKSFCANCGSAMPNLQLNGQLLVVPAGSLDEDVQLKPTAHIFCRSKSSWSKNLEGVKEFETFPG
nr:GFA family protein [Bacteriovorax sp. HI3]